MNKLKDIKDFEDLKELLILHKETIKKAALPVVVVAALLFFWMGENDEKVQIKENDRPVSEIVEQQSVEETAVDDVKSEIYVDISGCVYNPGVYKIKDGTRLFQVVEKAGGLTPEADTDSINQAEEVYDGQKILISSKGNSGENQMSPAVQESQNGKININTADSLKLQEIPGVGPTTAQKIIDYRQNYGKFKSKEDIVNVSGIGEKTYENIKDYIIV